jgi:hypothetical protein
VCVKVAGAGDDCGDAGAYVIAFDNRRVTDFDIGYVGYCI